MHIILWLAILKHKYMYKLNFINLEAEHELIALLQSWYKWQCIWFGSVQILPSVEESILLCPDGKKI